MRVTKSLARKIVSGFLEDVPRQLRSLQEKLKRGDAAGVRLVAHALKGASATVSAPGLRAAFMELQSAATNGELPRASSLLSAIEEQFEAFCSTLKQSGWM